MMKNNLAKDLKIFSESISLLNDEVITKNVLTDRSKHRFEVYLSNYLIGHIERLITIYEVVYKTIGENNFKYFSKHFLILNPPQAENMDQFGEGFSSYLKTTPIVDQVAFLPVLAEIDWLWYEQKIGEIIMPAGSLSLWNKIRTKQEIENIEIDEEKEEVITFKIIEDEYILTTKEVKS